MAASRMPVRLHLLHHVLPAVPERHGFSPCEFARCLYLGRGGPVGAQVERVERLLEMYHHAGWLDRSERLTVCTLFRPRDEVSSGESSGGGGRGAVAKSLGPVLAHHAAQPLSDEDRRLLPVIRQAIGEIGERHPLAGQYTPDGEPLPVASVSGKGDDNAAADAVDGDADGGVRLCPPHLARFQRQDPGWKPRAWQPQIDMAVMHAWLKADPVPKRPVEPLDTGPMTTRLHQAWTRGGPQGYPVTLGFIEECREALAHFHQIREENALLRRGVKQALDIRNKYVIGCFTNPTPETAVDRRRNALVRRVTQAYLDGSIHDAEVDSPESPGDPQ